MSQEVIYVEASAGEPNTRKINDACHQMNQRGFALFQATPSIGDDGRTLGFWLFFSESQADASRSSRAGSIVFPVETQTSPESDGSFWQEIRSKKSLGAALFITGIVAIVLGVALHFALRNDLIDTAVHLGYFFGVIGLFLFLIGLLIVF